MYLFWLIKINNTDLHYTFCKYMEILLYIFTKVYLHDITIVPVSLQVH